MKFAKESGSIFESMMLLHLTVLCEFLTPKAKIYYWRTVGGNDLPPRIGPVIMLD